MSLLNENLDITLGEVQDHCVSISARINENLDSSILRKVFSLPIYDEIQNKYWDIYKEIGHETLMRRAQQKLMDVFAEMNIEELTGSGIVWNLALNDVHIDGIVMSLFSSFWPDERSSTRTTIAFELYRLNKRNQYKKVAKVHIEDHFANAGLWRCIGKMWSQYPKNGGQFHGKGRWGWPIYQSVLKTDKNR